MSKTKHNCCQCYCKECEDKCWHSPCNVHSKTKLQGSSEAVDKLLVKSYKEQKEWQKTKLKYKDKKVKSCNCNRLIEHEAQEILDRINYFYLKIDGSIEFDDPQACQIYPLVIHLIEKLLNHENQTKKRD